jgi:hypothetical protein
MISFLAASEKKHITRTRGGKIPVMAARDRKEVS